ncbi:hypothetical protein [Dyadobacter endophyticus]|uniref:hypothetical protein n=1 Tax=Dyadobacter TaxID=120831 RepID=UPI00166EBA5F|nr:hypothetical protein [Dyadobacter endophyticus]
MNRTCWISNKSHAKEKPGCHWTIDFADKKFPHCIIRRGRSLTVCEIRGYDPETLCFRVCGLNPDKARFPDFDIYLDEISEMRYLKTVRREIWLCEAASLGPHST